MRLIYQLPKEWQRKVYIGDRFHFRQNTNSVLYLWPKPSDPQMVAHKYLQTHPLDRLTKQHPYLKFQDAKLESNQPDYSKQRPQNRQLKQKRRPFPTDALQFQKYHLCQKLLVHQCKKRKKPQGSVFEIYSPFGPTFCPLIRTSDNCNKAVSFIRPEA